MLVPSKSMKELLEARLQAYENQLHEDPRGLTYLTERRGLTREIVRAFRVGFVAEPLKGDARYKDRIAIPYLTPSGVVSFKFRSIDSSDPIRFAKDANDPNRIYNTRVLQRAPEVIITEGELDCIAVTQCGFVAVGIPGANNFKPAWSRVFFNRRVTVLADGDDAGREFGELVASKLYGVRVLELPADEDVASMLQQKGEDWIRDFILT